MKKSNKSDLNSKIKQVLVSYLRTQFILIVVVVLIVWGIMAIIPNLHPIIEILIVIFSYLVLSNLMDLFVSPYFLSKKAKINPFLIFASFFIGIVFFGIIGAILAVPIALIIKTVWEHYKSDH